MIMLKTNYFSQEMHAWLLRNVGPRTHYLVSSIGGVGWLAKRHKDSNITYWTISFEDDKIATWFCLIFPL